MPSFRRRASVVDADSVAEAPQPDAEQAPESDDAQALAEQAEAEAAAAEAAAAAARARAEAIRLRSQAQAAEAKTDAAEVDAEQPDAEDTEDVEDIEEAGDAAEAVDADGAEAAPKRRRFRMPRIRWGIVAAVVAILCTSALITLSVLMVISHRNHVQEQQRTAEYAAAARQGVVTLMSLDFNKAQEDVQRIIDNTTGQFKEEFEAQAEDFAQVAKDSKVITEVNVNVAAVKSMTDTNATAIVSATSRVTNAAGANQEPRSWRLLVDLIREGDQIKMSKVEFVP